MAKRLVVDCSTGERRVEEFSPVAPSITETQQAKISFTKAEALVKLLNTDWKVTRHQEQRELVAAGLLAKTSMTEEEFQALLVKRQGIREKSDSVEKAINSAASSDEVAQIPVEL